MRNSDSSAEHQDESAVLAAMHDGVIGTTAIPEIEDRAGTVRGRLGNRTRREEAA